MWPAGRTLFTTGLLQTKYCVIQCVYTWLFHACTVYLKISAYSAQLWWHNGRFGALRSEGFGFECHSSCHVYGSWASPSLVVACSTSIQYINAVCIRRERLWVGLVYRPIVDLTRRYR